MGRLKNSWDLTKQSASVLRKDKELAVIPVVSAAACAAIALLFGGAVYTTLTIVSDPAPGQDGVQASPVSYAVGLVGLFFIGIVAQFFTAVLIAGANERLAGGSPTLSSAAAKAWEHFTPVVAWAAINVTVGLVLSAIADRTGPLGDVVLRLVGAAWNVVTWLALPAIVIEGTGPVEGIKRSVHLLKTTWGENLIAQGGLGIITFLVTLVGVVVLGALSAVVPIVGIPLLVVYIGVTSAVLSALGGIYRAALYRYAVGLPNGEAFSDATLAGAFRAR
ncbi:MAG: DUF6159 family protein [Acidimicrobiales bacterium]|jgi:hypothetical protein|nr:DUF6159 family protein [Acidimicrobiales bacterium]